MTVTATCDAPGCGKTVAAVPPTFGAVVYAFPQDWWIQASRTRVIAACCQECLNAALKANPP